MARIKLCTLLGLIACLAALSDSPSDEAPEFYFTRLIYRQNPILHGFFRSFTMANPGPYRCPEFGGRNFFPPQGWGWATDSPGADCKLMGSHPPFNGTARLSESKLHTNHRSGVVHVSVRVHRGT